MPSHIQTPTPDLASSIDFYQRLGFAVLQKDGPAIVTDGKAVIEINSERTARAGIKLYRPTWPKQVIDELEALTAVLKTSNGYLFNDPSGTRVYLIESEEMEAPAIPANVPAILGNYMGVSLEMVDIPKSIALYETLGFTLVMGGPDQNFMVYANADGLAVSFMRPNTCPHLFFNPSLTYFNSGQNLPIIASIREAGIPITEEITQFNEEGLVDNVIIRDPGGLGFFIFND